MREKATQQLINTYTLFLQDIKKSAPILLESAYSNPYFISIPDGWFTTDSPRILIVGEEGFGTFGCGKQGEPHEVIDYHDIERIQNLNYTFLRKQLGKEVGDKFYCVGVYDSAYNTYDSFVFYKIKRVGE